MRKLGLTVLLMGTAVFTTARVAGAMNQCRQNAQLNFGVCLSQCQDDFTAAKFQCKNVDPVCGKACLAGWEGCHQTLQSILDTGQIPEPSPTPPAQLPNCTGGTDQCDADFTAAKTACPGAPCAPTDTVCNDCVDNAQVAHFLCVDACRDSFRTDGTAKALRTACHSGLKACIKACKLVPATPTPTPGT